MLRAPAADLPGDSIAHLAGDEALVHAVLQGIENTPTDVWRNITLQLLAQLSSQHGAVRAVVMAVLKQIGKQQPHLLVYPVVAGLRTSKGPVQQYNGLYDDMKAHSPELIRSCVVLVGELRRVAVLWEEEWQSTALSLGQSLNKVVVPDPCLCCTALQCSALRSGLCFVAG